MKGSNHEIKSSGKTHYTICNRLIYMWMSDLPDRHTSYCILCKFDSGGVANALANHIITKLRQIHSSLNVYSRKL